MKKRSANIIDTALGNFITMSEDCPMGNKTCENFTCTDKKTNMTIHYMSEDAVKNYTYKCPHFHGIELSYPKYPLVICKWAQNSVRFIQEKA